VKASPAIITVAVRGGPGFSSMRSLTLPSPDPSLPFSIVIQPTGLDAVYAHPSRVLTSTSTSSDLALASKWDGFSVYRQSLGGGCGGGGEGGGGVPDAAA